MWSRLRRRPASIDSDRHGEERCKRTDDRRCALGTLGFSVEEAWGPDWVWHEIFFFHVAVNKIFF